MKKIIIERLREIEKSKGITILFAVESGSRAWGLASKDSDYDVRFVYYRPMQEYLKLNSHADVITATYDKQGNPSEAKGCMIDMQGFDIYKFCRMINKSNPTTIEWLQSKIRYINIPPEELREWIDTNVNLVSLYHHYKSMCRQNYLKYLKSGNLVTYKKYLYAMRGLVNAKYVSQYETIPMMDFNTTFRLTDIPKHIKSKLIEIIDLKKQGKEKDIVQNIVRFDSYIESELKSNDDCPTRSKTIGLVKDLDDFVLKTINKTKEERT